MAKNQTTKILWASNGKAFVLVSTLMAVDLAIIQKGGDSAKPELHVMGRLVGNSGFDFGAFKSEPAAIEFLNSLAVQIEG